jgi:hypothetical protein
MMDPASALLAHIAIPPKLLVSLVVLGLALLIWMIVAIANSGKKQQQQAAPGAPPCNTCGQPGRWNYNGWVCDRCQRAIVPMAPGMPQQQYGQPGMPPGQYGQPGMPPGQYGQPGMPPGQYGQPGMPPQQQMGAPPMAAAPQGPTCQTCGGPGRWIPESNAWGCDRCRQLIAPPAQA